MSGGSLVDANQPRFPRQGGLCPHRSGNDRRIFLVGQVVVISAEQDAVNGQGPCALKRAMQSHPAHL